MCYLIHLQLILPLITIRYGNGFWCQIHTTTTTEVVGIQQEQVVRPHPNIRTLHRCIIRTIMVIILAIIHPTIHPIHTEGIITMGIHIIIGMKDYIRSEHQLLDIVFKIMNEKTIIPKREIYFQFSLSRSAEMYSYVFCNKLLGIKL